MESWILALPLLLLLLLVVAIGFACFKKWWWAAGLLFVALLLNWYGEVFALHPFGCLITSDSEDDIKVMTFNIHGPGADFNERIDGIVELIEGEDPDVLFLCEIFTPYKHYDEQLDSILKLQYPYSSFKNKTQWGNVFYSKFPIDTVEIVGITIGKSQPLATIDVNGKKLSFLGCHLSSNNYVDSKTKMEVDSVGSKSDAKRYFQTIEKGYRSRRQDVDTICQKFQEVSGRQEFQEVSSFRRFQEGSEVDPEHLIILGDMNDIGGSYTIRKLKSLGLQDAWWKGGFGLGGTRNVLGFPFRLDHILYGNGFELKGVKVVDTSAGLATGGLSDHDALVARFKIE